MKKTTKKTWCVANIQNGSVIRGFGTKEQAIEYAIENYGYVSFVRDAEQYVWVSKVPSC